MIAANIMTTGMHTLVSGATLSDAIRLAAKTRAAVPVVGEENKVFGVIPLKTLLKAALQEQSPDTAHQLPSFVKNIGGSKSIDEFIDKRYSRVLPHARLTEIAAMFMNGDSDCVLVVDDHERLLGMISPGDIFKRLWEYSEK